MDRLIRNEQRTAVPSMISLYIHIPFCAKKCRYCDFYSVPYNEDLAEAYLRGLSKEIELYRGRGLAGSAVRTVYIGGGTPSRLPAHQLNALCALVRERFELAAGFEWTVECNPESFTDEKADVLLGHGVTRCALGMQSLDGRELALLGRAHSPERCRELLRDPALARFSSIGVDLIYGLPGQSWKTLETSLDAVTDSRCITHVSAYELTLAADTPFGRHRSLLPLPNESEMAAMTTQLWQSLRDRGFEHYEVSNFAKPGHRCRHNEAYWDHAPYLGLGCAAHSYLPPERWANVRDINRYIDIVEAGHHPYEFVEIIDPMKLAMEMVFLGLRKAAGINGDAFREKCGVFFENYVNNQKIVEFTREGLLVEQRPYWIPTEKGLLMADAMARELV